MAKLNFEYCECGCKAHEATSKGLTYSIFNRLEGDKPFEVYSGYRRVAPHLGDFATWKDAVQAAQDHWDNQP